MSLLSPCAPRDGRAPTVLQLLDESLLDESRRAWHAGESYWRGRTHLNDTSIGIELENEGYRRGADGTLRWAPWPPQQIAVVTALCRDILRRHAITPFNVVGHSDIAWRRKQDPGPLFPLAAAGSRRGRRLAAGGAGKLFSGRTRPASADGGGANTARHGATGL